jgi:isocitrate/isopropylmalate dehydrogenase
MAMILACGAVLHYAAERGEDGARMASAAVYDAVNDAVEVGIRTPDLKGHTGTTEFTDAVIERVRAKLG